MSSTLFSTLIGLAGGFITYRYVAPEQLGIWVTFTTFSVYASVLRLGIPNGMNRELPFYMGRNEKEKAFSFAETTLAYSLATSVLLLLFAVSSFFFIDYYALDPGFIKALPVFALVVIVEPYSTYLSSTFRTSDNFNKLSHIHIIMTLVKAGSIYFVYLWGFEGYLIRELVYSLGHVFFLHIWRPLPFIKPIFRFKVFKTLFSIGFRIFVGSYLVSVITSLPRLFIINYGSTEELGLFSPVILLLSTIALVPATLNSYLYPRLSQKYGENISRASFWKNIRILYFLSVAIAIPASLLLYFLIDHVIQFFPKYIDSVPYIKLSGFAVLFVGYNLGTVLLVVFKEWKWYTLVVLFFGVTQLLSLYFFFNVFNEILKTAVLSIAATNFIMFFTTLFISWRVTHNGEQQT